MQSMKNVAVLTEDGRGICHLFSFPPRGIWQLKSPHPRELAIQGKKDANARVSAQGGGGLGAVWIDSYINFSVDTVQQNSNLHAIHTSAYVTFIFYLYSFFIAPVEGSCCKPKYRANVIHHSIFFFLPIFFLSLFLPCGLFYCSKIKIWLKLILLP